MESEQAGFRVAVVTPMLPIPQDRTRGRYIHETARAISRIAATRVFFQQPRYLRLPGIAPRSFLEGTAGTDYAIDGIDVEAFCYPAVTGLSRPLNGWVASRALTSRVRAFRPDIVVGYWVYPDGDAALRCARALGVPCVVGALGSDIHVRSGSSAWLTRRTIGGVDALLTVSEAMRQTAISDFGAAPGTTHTIVNGFNTGVFRHRDRTEARNALGVAGDARLIVYVGRLVEAKGLRELVGALSRMSSADTAPPRLALVGDGVMRDELLALVERSGLSRQVTFTGGLEPHEVATWLAAADLLTLPSWSEGYPNVVVEALACGCPVVATDVGGTREIIDGDSGLLVPPKDERALAHALQDALSRSWDRKLIASRMRRTWDDVAGETLAVCRGIVARRRAAVS